MVKIDADAAAGVGAVGGTIRPPHEVNANAKAKTTGARNK
jgi:hypothetical protein